MVPSPKVRRPSLPIVVLGTLAVALVVLGTILVVSRLTVPPTRLNHGDVGPNPFLSAMVAPTPSELEPLLNEAVRNGDIAEAAIEPSDDEDAATSARIRAEAANQAFEDEGIGLIRPRTVAAPAVLPGDPEELCSVTDLIAGFRADPAAAEAFASVHDIDLIGIGEFLAAMRAGYLADDLEVLNHRYRNGVADPFVTTLAAGTAVLVDDQGIPRVRCRCGNPLLPLQVELDGKLVDAALFADRVVTMTIADEVPAMVDLGVDGRFTNDGAQALGPPDLVSVSLGEDPGADRASCRFQITLEFVDNRLVDGPGDDLQVVERGRSESTFIAIGNAVDDLRPVGEISGGDSSIDISSVAEPGETFSLVQLCDGPDRASEVPGSDIDAVLALHLQLT